MSVVRIEQIDRLDLDRRRLRGAELDLMPGMEFDTHVTPLSGWVLGREERVVGVEVEVGGAPPWRAPVSAERLDVADVFPDAPEAAASGFLISMRMLGLPETFDAEVRAVLGSSYEQVPIARVRMRRKVLRTDFDPTLQPLMLTSLGRTGTHWVLLLLAQHPSVVAYRPLQFEPRIASYWMQVLNALSDPTSYLQGLAGTHVGEESWWLGELSRDVSTQNVFGWIANNTLREFHDWWATEPDPPLAAWFGRSHPEALAAFCQERIDSFYRAADGQDGEAKYFVEKLLPDHVVPPMLWELYPQARELVLTRDFRDVVCSVAAFARKLGYSNANGNGTGIDEEFIRNMRAGFVDLCVGWKRRPGAQLLRYEDLILRPVETLEKVLDYLGLTETGPSAADLLAEAARTDSGRQRLHATTTDPKASIGRWRRELPPDLQAVCLDAFGDVLQEFGYSTEVTG